MKKLFTFAAIITAVIYSIILYYMLFRWFGREMVITSQKMLENYNYWDQLNLVPFKTITKYFTGFIDGSIRGHAIRNLGGNLFLLFPVGFYLPFFFNIMRKFWLYCIFVSVGIIVIEVMQVLTMSGSLDIDDFILNIAGALIGFLVFKYTCAKKLLIFRSW